MPGSILTGMGHILPFRSLLVLVLMLVPSAVIAQQPLGGGAAQTAGQSMWDKHQFDQMSEAARKQQQHDAPARSGSHVALYILIGAVALIWMLGRRGSPAIPNQDIKPSTKEFEIPPAIAGGGGARSADVFTADPSWQQNGTNNPAVWHLGESVSNTNFRTETLGAQPDSSEQVKGTT